MNDILAAAARPVLDRFARSEVLVAFDFDGTLAPIVRDPTAAAMRARTRRLLASVADHYPCVVISGRARDDVAARLAGIGLRQVIGNHGSEPWPGGGAAARLVSEWRDWLGDRLRATRGVVIEDKVYSIAIHYRHCAGHRSAKRAIERVVAQLAGARIVGGKLVVNVIPTDAPHKGMALERERQLLGCQTAIYVGDDETDEDVFALGLADRLLTIRVGASRASRADYWIRDQRGTDRLLEALLSLRRRQPRSNG